MHVARPKLRRGHDGVQAVCLPVGVSRVGAVVKGECVRAIVVRWPRWHARSGRDFVLACRGAAVGGSAICCFRRRVSLSWRAVLVSWLSARSVVLPALRPSRLASPWS